MQEMDGTYVPCEMLAKYKLHRSTLFLNENGFNVEYYDIDPDEYYLFNTFTSSEILIYVRKIMPLYEAVEC